MKEKIVRYIWVGFSVLLVVVVSLSLGSLALEKYFFPASLLVHFQLQYWVVALVCVSTLLYFRKYIFFISGFLFVSVVFSVWIRHVDPFATAPSHPDIIFLNNQYDQKETALVVNMVADKKPSYVALVESNPVLVNELTKIKGDPIIDHRSYASSCTLFSDVRNTSSTVLGKTYLPICILHLDDYDLVTVHPHRPTNAAILKENVAFFDDIARLIRGYEEQRRSFIIVGDFNSTRYSSYFRERFGKYDQEIIYTWLPNTPITLPLDHVLTNMKVEIGRSEYVGSDHRALLIHIISK